ncbi:MAG: SagB/ThcOx family dehydrogenase [Candidatus Odinarchaeota archaeon]
MSNEIGKQFCLNTRYERGKLPRRPLSLSTKPSVYKTYENSKQIQLPEPQTQQGPGLWQLLNQRRSVRKFSSKAMTQEELSQILWATQGVTEPGVPAYGEMIGLRTAPSAGALYPVETYLCINNVIGIDPGLYHYSIENRTLELIIKGDFGEALAKAALDQEMLAKGNVVVIWTAIFERSKWKYRQRAYRYVFLDAGHIGQNLALAAEGLGLGSCQVAAFFDNEVNHLLQVDGENESAIYLSVIGHKKKN